MSRTNFCKLRQYFIFLSTFLVPRYLTGVERSRIGETHLYRVPVLHSTLRPDASCLTCHLNETNPGAGLSECGNAKILLSDDSSRYLLHCLGPAIPYTAVFNLSTNGLISILDQNDHIHAYLRGREEPQHETLSFPSENMIEISARIRVRLLLPRRVVDKEGGGEKVEVIIFLGSERGTQQIDNRSDKVWPGSSCSDVLL